MIKLNRIGNKLGLAGAVGVLLAIGMVANQMATESSIEQGSARAARSQQVADNSLSEHIDLRKIQLAAALSGWREPRESKRPGRFAAPQGGRRERLDAATRNAQRRTPGAAAEDQGADDGFTARGRSRQGATTLLARSTSARSSRMNGPRPSRPSGFASMRSWTIASISNVCCSGRCQGERAAGGCWKLGLPATQSGHREGKTEASLKDVFNKLRGEAMTASCWSWSEPGSIVKRFLAANEEAVKTGRQRTTSRHRTVKAAGMSPTDGRDGRRRAKGCEVSKDEVMAIPSVQPDQLIMAIVVAFAARSVCFLPRGRTSRRA